MFFQRKMCVLFNNEKELGPTFSPGVLARYGGGATSPVFRDSPATPLPERGPALSGSCLQEIGLLLACKRAVDQVDRRGADFACVHGPVNEGKLRLRRSCSLQKVLLTPVPHNPPAGITQAGR